MERPPRVGNSFKVTCGSDRGPNRDCDRSRDDRRCGHSRTARPAPGRARPQSSSVQVPNSLRNSSRLPTHIPFQGTEEHSPPARAHTHQTLQLLLASFPTPTHLRLPLRQASTFSCSTYSLHPTQTDCYRLVRLGFCFGFGSCCPQRAGSVPIEQRIAREGCALTAKINTRNFSRIRVYRGLFLSHWMEERNQPAQVIE